MEETVKDRMGKFLKFKGITVADFEKECGLSNGYLNSMRKSFGREKLNNVLKCYPELNRDWLIYGEGSMLMGDINGSNNAIGHHASVNVSHGEVISKMIDQVSHQQQLLEKSQEQIDRMLSIIEELTAKIK